MSGVTGGKPTPRVNTPSDVLLGEDTIYSYGTVAPPPAYDSHSPQKKKRSSRYKYVISLSLVVLVVITTFIIVNVVVVLPKSQDYINQSVEVDIKHVELHSVSTKGIQIKVEGLNFIDYDSIDDTYFKNLMKLGGGIFQTASLDSQAMDIQTIIDDDKDGKKLISIGTVDVPVIDVNIGNKRETEFDMIVSIHPATSNILGLIKELLIHPDKIFKIYGSTYLNIKLGYLPIGAYKIDFQQEIIGSHYFQFDGDAMNFQDLTILRNETKYDVDFTLSLPNPVKNKLFAFNIPQLEWELFVQDCFKRPTIGLFDYPINTNSFRISPLDDILSINISTSISKLDPALQDKCSEDTGDNESDVSPLSLLIDEFVNNKELPILLKNTKGSKEYPGFINELLKNIDFQFGYKSNFDTNKLVHNISIDQLSFEFQNGDVSKPIINGNINLMLSLPNGLDDFRINQIRGLPVLFHEGVEFGEINLEEWHPCENEIQDDNNILISFRLNREQIIISDKKVFGKVLNEVLNTGSSTVLIDATLDALVDTLLGEFEIDKIHAKSESDIRRKDMLPFF